MINDQASFELLCHAVLDGKATQAELECFRELLRRSAAARMAYAEQTQIHALLTWQQGRAAVPASVVLAPMDFAPASPTFFSQWLGNLFPFWGRVLAGGVAAVTVLLLGFAFWLVAHRDPKGVQVAAQKGVWVDILAVAESPYLVGQRVALERLEMQTGSLRFRISSGAVVDLGGPVSLELVDPMRLRLLRGSINTDVGNEAKGFVVETPSASVLDIGTRFGTSVGEDGSTDIAVFEGEVQVYRTGEPLTQENRLASLVEGEAAHMRSPMSELERLNLLTLMGGRLKVRGVNAPNDPVVLNVSDNIKRANFYRCYAVIPGGMSEGALASLTRAAHHKLKWHALPGQPFPPELMGADVIGTFQYVQRELARTDISLDLARPCSVYLMFDSRATPPEWLRRDFQDTGLRLRSGPWGKSAVEVIDVVPEADGERYLLHSVWRRNVPAADTVKLGPPGIPGERYRYAMYGISVKALE
jgi:hypothetical protein